MRILTEDKDDAMMIAEWIGNKEQRTYAVRDDFEIVASNSVGEEMTRRTGWFEVSPL